MMLMTYQVLDYLTFQNDRYSRIKKLLGIPQEKNIYWCCSANNVEQAIINSFCVEPNEPHLFVLFETDDYYKIDKIKWNRAVEKELNHSDSFDWNSLLDISNDDAVDYIVTEIPEKKFQVRLNLSDMPGFIESLKEEKLTAVQHSAIMSLNQEVLEFYDQTMRDMVENIDRNILAEYSKLNRNNKLLDLRLLKIAFDGSVLPLIYCIGRSMLRPNDDSLFGKSFNLLEYHENGDLHNEYTKWCFEMADMDDNEAYASLADVYKKVYKGMMVQSTDFGRKVMPNEPCPCGSGLKYKKCCKTPKALPDVSQLMCL